LSDKESQIIHSLSTGKAPSLDVDWWVDDNPNSEYGVHFQRLSSRTSELKNETNHLLATVTRTPENTELMKKAMEKCQELDKEIVEWLEDLPESFRWKTVAWEDYNPKCDYSKAEAFPGRIDMYADLWVVNLWNVMRCMRIVLASLIVRFTAWIISPADYRTTPEYAASARVCVEAIADIIASVPYQLGWFAKHQDLRERAQLSGFACGEDDAEKGLAGYFLLWPLTCIQGQDYLTDAQRTWVKGRLKCIGNQIGVRYGNMLSQVGSRIPFGKETTYVLIRSCSSTFGCRQCSSSEIALSTTRTALLLQTWPASSPVRQPLPKPKVRLPRARLRVQPGGRPRPTNTTSRKQH